MKYGSQMEAAQYRMCSKRQDIQQSVYMTPLRHDPFLPRPQPKRLRLWPLSELLFQDKGKRVNIYTYSKYAFLFCTLMLPYGKKGLLTVGNSPIKHGPETLNLLEVVKLPEQGTVRHCAKVIGREGKSRSKEDSIRDCRTTSLIPFCEQLRYQVQLYIWVILWALEQGDIQEEPWI